MNAFRYRWRTTSIAAAVFLIVSATPARAQTHTLDLRVAELDERGRLTYQNFIYALTPGSGRFMIAANHLRLARADYHETSVGVGYRFARGDASASYFIAHVGRGSDEQTYLQPAVLAYHTAGRWTVAGFGMHYIPLTDGGPSQWLLDPVEVQYQLVDNVIVGASAYYWRPQGGPHALKAGGQVGVKLGRITPLIAVRQVNDPSGLQVQFRVVSAF